MLSQFCSSTLKINPSHDLTLSEREDREVIEGDWVGLGIPSQSDPKLRTQGAGLADCGHQERKSMVERSLKRLQTDGERLS
jgi:hypothetical protein